ncbi:MAG: hypothetical protein COV76_08675 [Candidatus Omnitrophica bacterium CG11_big_fil_rev_8_21_14_0_20_64_10]|nr:MAG: hypothetical protein COV76_08675 [Candidatus Omnitrophica bacterium CG11_big_fil_rev_8_21_14_0_20_64_10]
MKRSLLFWVVYTAAVSALLLLGLEGVGRVMIHLKHGVPGKTYGLWIADPELGADHRPNGYNTHTRVNDWGFRNPEDVVVPKPADGLRIIVFGGSTTFGYNLADGDTYTERLEAKLRQVPGWEHSQVLNAGRINFSAGHNLILMKRLVPKLQPDLVILYEGVNEMQNAWMLQLRDGVNLDTLADRWGVLAKGFDQNRWLKRNSILVRFFDYRIKELLTAHPKETGPAAPQSALIHPWIIENYRYLFGAMLDFLEERQVPVIMIRYASVHNPLIVPFSEISAEMAEARGIPVYEMERHLNETGRPLAGWFIATGAHVTAEGARRVADGLFQMIEEAFPLEEAEPQD